MKKLLTMLVVLAMVLSFAGTGVMAEETGVSSVGSTQFMIVDLINKTQLTGNNARLFTQLSGDKTWDDVAVVEFSIPNINSLSTASIEFQSYWEKPTTNYVDVYATRARMTNGDGAATANAVNSSTLALAGTLPANSTATANQQARTVVLDSTVLKENAEDGILTLVVKIPNTTARTSKIKSTFVSANMKVTYTTGETEFSVSDKTEYTDRVFVDLIKNEVRSNEANMFTQDHSTNNLYDFDNVTLVRYTVSNAENAKNMTVSLCGSSNKYTTTKLQAYLVGNDWDSETTDFSFIKNGSQTLLGETDVIVLGGNSKLGTVSLALDEQAIQNIKETAANGTFTIMWRAINTTKDRSDITYTFAVASGETLCRQESVLKITEGIESLAGFSDGSTVTAERYVVKGSTDAPISAVPIIALYEDGELSSIKIGEAISLDGTGQTVSASVTATETLSNPKATFFLWTSLQELVPLMESSSIE